MLLLQRLSWVRGVTLGWEIAHEADTDCLHHTALHSAAKLCQLEESGVQHEAPAAPSKVDKTSMAEKACTHTQPQIAAGNEGWQSSNQPQRVLGHGSHESPTAQVASHLGGKTQQAEGRPTPRGQSDRVVPFLKEPRTAEARANEQRMQAVIDGVTQEHGGCHAVIDGR